MSPIRKQLVIALTVLGLGAATLPAQAQVTPEARAQMHAKWGERAAAHQKKIHDKLMLTPNQEAAWATYVAAAKPPMRGERGQRGERGAWKTMSAPQRMEKRIEMAKQHIGIMETRLAALNTFYAVLTPEQKKVFDATGGGHGGRGGHHRMRHRAVG
jgi:protein CpxP